MTPCFQTLTPDVKVLTQARMLLATARDLHGDLEGAYLLRSALADQGDAARHRGVLSLAINALALAALESDEERFTNFLVEAEDALERCDPDRQMQDNVEGSDGQATQAGIKVARTLLGLLQSQAQPERHLAQASFDATPEAVVARSILTAHCALIGGRNVVVPDDFEEGEVLEHHADALRALLTASSEFMAPSHSQKLKPYQFEVWRLRIRIAAAQSPLTGRRCNSCLVNLSKPTTRDQTERRTFLSWRYRPTKNLVKMRRRPGSKNNLSILIARCKSKHKGGLVSSPDFTQHAHDLLQQMSAIVDALIVAVEESRFDDLEGLLGQRDVCQNALEELAQAQPLRPESLEPSLEQIQEKDRRLEAILKTGQLRSREGLDALAQRTRARQAYQAGESR